MLEVQKYLQVKTPESLEEELGIKAHRHPTLPLIGFKYDQRDSPKTHPIVKECRGLALELGTWDLVAKGFERFFNVEETEDYSSFDWDDYVAFHKEDGSLIILFFYEGAWHVKTSGSFGFSKAQDYDGDWHTLFWDSVPFSKSALRGLESKTLVFEICSPWNKVVRQYYQQTLYLLSVFETERTSSVELPIREVEAISERLDVLMPKTIKLPKDQLKTYILDLEERDDRIFEGVVIRDKNNLRFKWKTKRYLDLHHMLGNGNILLPKNLVRVALAGECGEYADMPQIKTALSTVDNRLREAYDDLVELWNKFKDLESQKDFAIGISEHPLKGILFRVRKERGDLKVLTKIWRESGEIITKSIFGESTFSFDIIQGVDDE